MRARLQLALAQSRYGLLVGLTIAIGTATVLWLGVRHVQANSLTLGNLLLVMAYLGQLFAPLKIIGRKVGSLQGHLTSVDRAFSLLDEMPEVVERRDAQPLSRALGAITFRNVSFRYQDNRRRLHDFGFAVPSGTPSGPVRGPVSRPTNPVSLFVR